MVLANTSMASPKLKGLALLLGVSTCATIYWLRIKWLQQQKSERKRKLIRFEAAPKKEKTDEIERPELPPMHEKEGDIGAIFGLDVGGTLAKLVYFEEYDPPTSWDDNSQAPAADTFGRSHQVQFRERSASQEFLDGLGPPPPGGAGGLAPVAEEEGGEAAAAAGGGGRGGGPPPPPPPGAAASSPGPIKRARSLVNLEALQNKEALEQFYKFMAKTGDVGTLRQEEDLEFYSHQLRGRLHFVSFETARMEDAVELIASNRLHRSVREMGCTGGGAHKFAGLFRERLAVGLRKHDEMDCLVRGLQFAGRAVVAEFFTYASPDREPALRSRQPRMSDFDEETMSMDSSSSHTVQDAELKQKELERRREKIQKQQEQKKKLSKKLQKDYNLKIHRPNTILSKYPYLIVSIGTGVSILKVEGPGRYERVSGSSVGGGTFYGLARALLAGGAPGAPAGAAAAFGYEDALGLARRGDSRNVDMLVGDIYGSGYDRFELSSDTVASSFGKLVNSKYMADLSRAPRREDFARGLLIMITMNIGQIAYLNAQLCKTKRIVFIGTFLRNNEISCQRLAFAIDYWSGGKMEALFMEHEGYLGALGAFLNSQNIIDETPQSTDGNQLPPARLTRSFSEASSYDRVFQQLPVHVREKIEKLRAKGGPVAAAAAPPKHNNSDEREATARPSWPPEEKETSTKNFMQRLHRTEPVMQQHRNSGNAAESEETTSLECFPENSDEECQLDIDDESQVLGGQAVFRTTL